MSLLTFSAWAQPDPPIISLPVGIVTDSQPRIEWRGDAQTAYQARITGSTSSDIGILWDSGQVTSSDPYVASAGVALPSQQSLYTHVRIQGAGGWSGWNPRMAPFRVETTEQLLDTVYTYDLSYTRSLGAAQAFEQAHLVSALQGIVNREAPRLFIYWVDEIVESGDVDEYWMARYREPGEWLENASLQPMASIENLVQTFAPHINGVVLWDRNVNATSNIASTVAGIEDLLPIPYDTSAGSLYHRLVAGGPQLSVEVNLVGKFTGSGTIPDIGRASSGSAKCDAYLWAKEMYIDTGKCNVRYQGHYIDAYWISNPWAGNDFQNHTLSNHDFFIANQGFLWDLLVWGDETPVDDPGQPLGTDLNTLKEIMLASYNQLGGEEMIHVGGFTPWAFKYTTVPGAGGTHDAVATEWELVRVLSAYNAYIDADALHISAMANASFFQHLPLPERYSQPLPPMEDELIKQGILNGSGNVEPNTYLYHYVGDYDAAAWTTNTLPSFWDAPERGTVTLSWAVSPTNSARAPHFFHYAFRTRTGRDTFVAGSSGPGYVNPGQIVAPRQVSGLPSGAAAFGRHGQEFFRKFDYDFTGFVINGHLGTNTSAGQRIYLPFSSGGIVDLRYSERLPILQDNMPVFFHTSDLGGSYFGGDNAPVDDGNTIAGHANINQTEFLMYRTVISNPAYYRDVNAYLNANYSNRGFVFCSADLFSYVGRKWAGGSNEQLATYLFDTIPDVLEADEVYQFEIAVRNDGWETWRASGAEPYVLSLQFVSAATPTVQQSISLIHDLGPGEGTVLSAVIETPLSPGEYQLHYEMRKGTAAFSTQGDMPWENPVVIEPGLSTVPEWRIY